MRYLPTDCVVCNWRWKRTFNQNVDLRLLDHLRLWIRQVLLRWARVAQL